MARSVKPKPPLEKTIKDEILAYLVVNQFLAWVNNQGAMFGEHKGKKWAVKFSTMPGLSDIQAVRAGRSIFIEVKRRPGQNPEPDQEKFLQSVRRYGGIAFVACSIEDVYGEMRMHNFSMIEPATYYNQIGLHSRAIEASKLVSGAD